MDDLQREKEKGLDPWYVKDVFPRKWLMKSRHQTPGFGLAAQLFAVMCKFIIAKLGPEEGESLIREAVEYFGRERGKRIAEKVKKMNKPLSLKNWILYTDVSSANFPVHVRFENGDLAADVYACSFNKAAEEWGLGEYSAYYCKYADYAILEGYNPDVKLELEQRQKTGCDHCKFRYIMKEDNKGSKR